MRNGAGATRTSPPHSGMRNPNPRPPARRDWKMVEDASTVITTKKAHALAWQRPRPLLLLTALGPARPRQVLSLLPPSPSSMQQFSRPPPLDVPRRPIPLSSAIPFVALIVLLPSHRR
eukprot:9152874-Pyramimonas_sp.AAC.1